MNFSFQFVCSTQIKVYRQSGCLEAFFWYCVRQDGWSFRGLCPWTHWGAHGAPRPPAAPTVIAYRAFGRIPLSSMPSRQIWPTTLNSLKKGLNDIQIILVVGHGSTDQESSRSAASNLVSEHFFVPKLVALFVTRIVSVTALQINKYGAKNVQKTMFNSTFEMI